MNDKFTVYCPTSDPTKAIRSALLIDEEHPWEKKKAENRTRNQLRTLLQKHNISTCIVFYLKNPSRRCI